MPKIDWTVEPFTIRYVPCPPEHAAAWWNAMRIVHEAALAQLAKKQQEEQPQPAEA